MGQKSGVVEREVKFTATDGALVPAFIAEPSGAPDAPRVVIAPEIFGLSPWIRSVAQRLAREGFRAVAPEIFARDQVPMGSDFLARMRRMDLPQTVRDLEGALALLGGSGKASGKAGTIGFCLGGALSILLAADAGLDACVACYGRPRWPMETKAPHAIDAAPKVRAPVLGIYGKHDKGIPVAAAEELRAALPPGSELVLYDAGHAFLNDTRPDMYVEAQATLAWAKIIGYLRRAL